MNTLNSLSRKFGAEHRCARSLIVSTGYIGTDRILWTDEMIHRILKWPFTSVPLTDGTQAVLPPSVRTRKEVAVGIKNSCKKLSAKRTEAYIEKLRNITIQPPCNEGLLASRNSGDRVLASAIQAGAQRISLQR